jgi:hypothetical protein
MDKSWYLTEFVILPKKCMLYSASGYRCIVRIRGDRSIANCLTFINAQVYFSKTSQRMIISPFLFFNFHHFIRDSPRFLLLNDLKCNAPVAWILEQKLADFLLQGQDSKAPEFFGSPTAVSSGISCLNIHNILPTRGRY